jgi:diguanylate cyclase (GGDEF)-like protein
MTALRGTGVKFFLLVMVPALLTVAITATAVFNLLTAISDDANQTARARTELAARAAIMGVEDQNRALVHDNAKRDEATLLTIGESEDAWVKYARGSGTGAGLYDYVFVADIDGKSLSGYGGGAKLDGRAISAFAAPVAGLAEGFRSGDPKRSSGFAMIGEGLFALAVAPIDIAKDASAAGRDMPRLLVIARSIGLAQIEGLSKRYLIDGLAFSPGIPSDHDGVTIAGIDGKPVGKFVWPQTRSGENVRDRAMSQVRTSLVLVFFIVAMLLAAIWNNSRRMASGEANALHASLHDELSGLPNRRSFSAHMRGLAGQPFAVLFVDIDRFKEVNDSYGHEMGDRLIRASAAGIATLAPPGGMVARLGGDEFAMLIEGPDALARATALANLVTGFMCLPFEFDGRIISVGASIGIVGPEYADCTPDELIRRADMAMYRAKKNGRNQSFVYAPDLDREREERRKLASALRSAMNAGEISLHYQPYVSAGTREIAGVEALLRWTSPELGPVNPASFVSVAEEFGLIDELGMQVLFAACAQAALWPSLKMSINVSPVQFANLDFIDTVKAAIARAGIQGGQIELEITEGHLIDDPEQARSLIYRLHDMGVSVSIDDFGTGYSSIGYLRRFDFDKLKIDRSLVVGIMTNPEAQKIIQATVLIADALSLKVTAEGVEHEEEAMVLRAAGVDQFQGYLFHRPMPAAAIDALISAPSADRRAPLLAGAA